MGFDHCGCDAEKIMRILQTEEQKQWQNSKDMIFIDVMQRKMSTFGENIAN